TRTLSATQIARSGTLMRGAWDAEQGLCEGPSLTAVTENTTTGERALDTDARSLTRIARFGFSRVCNPFADGGLVSDRPRRSCAPTRRYAVGPAGIEPATEGL